MTPNEFIRTFKDKYGLTEVDHPAMNAHYLGNYPIDLEYDVQDNTQVQKMMDQLVIELLEVVKDDVSFKDGRKNTKLLNIIKGLKKSTSLGYTSGK